MRFSNLKARFVWAASASIILFMSASAFAGSTVQYLDRGEFRLAYRVFGQGEPLFLLNGGPGRSSDTFIPLAERLVTETHRQVILFDQRGTGLSTIKKPTASNITLDLMIDDLEMLRIHLKFEKISLFGHSFGGMYAMGYAARFPKNVSALLLSCSAGVDLDWMKYSQHNMISRLSEKDRLRLAYLESDEAQIKDPKAADREATRLVAPVYVYNQKYAAQITRDLMRYNAPGINPLVWKSMKTYNLRESLRGFSAPTQIIDGRQDFLGEQVPISIRAAIPNSRLELIDECAHYPWLDQPTLYFGLIRAFFEKNKNAS